MFKTCTPNIARRESVHASCDAHEEIRVSFAAHVRALRSALRAQKNDCNYRQLVQHLLSIGAGGDGRG